MPRSLLTRAVSGDGAQSLEGEVAVGAVRHEVQIVEVERFKVRTTSREQSKPDVGDVLYVGEFQRPQFRAPGAESAGRDVRHIKNVGEVEVFQVVAVSSEPLNRDIRQEVASRESDACQSGTMLAERRGRSVRDAVASECPVYCDLFQACAVLSDSDDASVRDLIAVAQDEHAQVASALGRHSREEIVRHLSAARKVEPLQRGERVHASAQHPVAKVSAIGQHELANLKTLVGDGAETSTADASTSAKMKASQRRALHRKRTESCVRDAHRDVQFEHLERRDGLGDREESGVCDAVGVVQEQRSGSCVVDREVAWFELLASIVQPELSPPQRSDDSSVVSCDAGQSDVGHEHAPPAEVDARTLQELQGNLSGQPRSCRRRLARAGEQRADPARRDDGGRELAQSARWWSTRMPDTLRTGQTPPTSMKRARSPGIRCFDLVGRWWSWRERLELDGGGTLGRLGVSSTGRRRGWRRRQRASRVAGRRASWQSVAQAI